MIVFWKGAEENVEETKWRGSSVMSEKTWEEEVEEMVEELEEELEEEEGEKQSTYLRFSFQPVLHQHQQQQQRRE